MSITRAVSCLRPIRSRFLAIRTASAATSEPGSSKVQLQKPNEEEGFFSYGRNYSRDPKFKGVNKPLQGDTPGQFLFRRLGHAYEVYPLLFLAGFWFTIFCATAYYSFTKIEIWFDRSKSMAPWDWERSRDSYWKKGTVAFDLEGKTRQRCELMEILQDEMLEAAKKRGTR
ncbi:hypothetical protein V3C99_014064 [Haemonchus contortus]|uniref:Defective mitochondrial respiration family member protein 1 n=1 Tax=Haemonchus contortus TaxID=6289 RepID=A0A7I4YRS0_HAECO|nr:Protein F22B5.4 [Haemonchus contortus]